MIDLPLNSQTNDQVTWLDDGDGDLISSCGDYLIVSGTKTLRDHDTGLDFYYLDRPETRPHLAFAIVPASNPGLILFSHRGGSKQLERIPYSRIETAMRKRGAL